MQGGFLLRQSKDVLMILMDQSSGNPLDLEINMVMVDKNNQVYLLSDGLFPAGLPLLEIPKMDGITSISDKYVYTDVYEPDYLALLVPDSLENFLVIRRQTQIDFSSVQRERIEI